MLTLPYLYLHIGYAVEFVGDDDRLHATLLWWASSCESLKYVGHSASLFSDGGAVSNERDTVWKSDI